ncbi:hypothetical protein ACIBF1_14155 [Spirillospora sp. NPDC050679]
MTARERAGRRLVDELFSRARPMPWTVVWRWRYELLLAGVVGGVVTATVAGYWGVALAAVVLPFLALRPRVRAWTLGACWVVVTQHRVRTACAQSGVHNLRGRLPALMWTRRTPFGERVLLWCPAGVSVHDFAAVREEFAAACWAAEVRVEADRGHRQLVRLEVVRRPVVRHGGREPGGAAPAGPLVGSAGPVTGRAGPPGSA